MQVGTSSRSSRASSCGLVLSMLLLGLASGCPSGSAPTLVNVDAEPDTWSASTIDYSTPFSITVDVLNFDSPVSSVRATVEGTSLTFDLSKISDVANGERWRRTSTLQAFSDFAPGTYFIGVTARDAVGDTTTLTRAATLTIAP